MSAVGQALVEVVVDPPAGVRRIKDEYLRPLPPLRSRSILPIAVAGVKLASMRSEYPHFRPAHEPAGTVPRSRLVRDFEIGGQRRGRRNCKQERKTKHRLLALGRHIAAVFVPRQ